MDLDDFKLDLEWTDRYCPDIWELYYDYMYSLIYGLIGGSLFPVVNLDSPVYYGCDGTARCDGFYIKGDKCMFIDKSFNGERRKDIDFLPYRALRECIERLLELKYYF